MKLIVNITSIMLLILSASGSIEAQSQSSNRGSRPARLGKIEIVDKSFMECVYEHSNYDPFLMRQELSIGFWKSDVKPADMGITMTIYAIRYLWQITMGNLHLMNSIRFLKKWALVLLQRH